MNRRLAAPLVCGLLLGLAGCAGSPPKSTPAPAGETARAGSDARKVSPYAPAKEDPSKRGNYTAGGLYAPGVADAAPDVAIDVSLIPEPEVVAEPRSRYGNRSTYSVLGKKYHVLDDAEGYVEEGLASYYGTKFHGRKTSNMEVYDMYAFTAAHKTLPLPSYAQVTNLDNGTSVVVRVNDRGPFHKGRIIDLSYAAAIKLGITHAGTGRVEVRALLPGEGNATYADKRGADKPEVQPATAPVAPSSMDKLVAALPVSAAGALQLPPGVRIATGKPAAVGRNPASSPPAASTSVATADDVTLQVASFSARGNADRALAMLRDAGIDRAQLQGATSNGQQVWRLRVGPLDAGTASTLTHRIAGLGFGVPQRVRE
ncbi:septal ring lytic transglycosylase RlpA family protein [Lysobacter sp. F6437]|uniref:septal ring lytic transglycosylase RlpA family protein n=1 Tax=Lysobacter sp. F6437 TaxID=3459296 RepID=UPI00403DB006